MKDCDLVFLIAGMGGGTGSGAAPIVAEIAAESGALVIAFVTMPFSFEGGRRAKQAEEGLIALRRVWGPEACELYFSCQPPGSATDAAAQTVAIYRAIVALLEAEGASFRSIVCETLFLRNPQMDLASVRAARHRVDQSAPSLSRSRKRRLVSPGSGVARPCCALRQRARLADRSLSPTRSINGVTCSPARVAE